MQDLGEMHVPDGRPVIGTNAADTGPDGTIYFVGAITVEATAGEQDYGGKIGDTPFRLALFIYHPKAD